MPIVETLRQKIWEEQQVANTKQLQFFPQILLDTSEYGHKTKQAHSLRAHVEKLQTPWDYKRGKKNQNYYKWSKTKESFKIHMKSQDVWAGFNQILVLQNQIYWEDTPDWPLSPTTLPSHKGPVREQGVQKIYNSYIS